MELKWLVVALKCGDTYPICEWLSRNRPADRPSFWARLKTGRVSRREFWGFQITNFVLSLLMLGIFLPVEGSRNLIYFIIGCALSFPSVYVAARRLHDIGHTERLAFIVVASDLIVRFLRIFGTGSVPFVSILVLLAGLVYFVSWLMLWALATRKSTPGDNQYGACPVAEESPIEVSGVYDDLFSRVKSRLNPAQNNAPGSSKGESEIQATESLAEKAPKLDHFDLMILFLPLGAIAAACGLFAWANSSAGSWTLVLYILSAVAAFWGIMVLVAGFCKLRGIGLEKVASRIIACFIVAIPTVLWLMGCNEALSDSNSSCSSLEVYLSGQEMTFFKRSGYYFFYKRDQRAADRLDKLAKMAAKVGVSNLEETINDMSAARNDIKLSEKIAAAILEDNIEEARKYANQIHDPGVRKIQMNLIKNREDVIKQAERLETGFSY